MYTADDHTFVVCAYKENPYIGDTIDSLKKQTLRSKIILSTSTPSNYLAGVCERFGIAMTVNPSPHLAGDDWNHGYDAATTRLVTLAHQDDYYAPTFLEETLHALNRFPEQDCLMAFTDYFELRNGEQISQNAILRIKRIMNAPFLLRVLNSSPFVKCRILAFGDSICCPAVTFVKETVGPHPFDTRFVNSCDYKTWVDLASKRGRFVYIPRRLLGHRIYAESATTRNLADNIRKGEDLQIMTGLWPRPLAAIINGLYAQSERSNKL